MSYINVCSYTSSKNTHPKHNVYINLKYNSIDLLKITLVYKYPIQTDVFQPLPLRL